MSALLSEMPCEADKDTIRAKIAETLPVASNDQPRCDASIDALQICHNKVMLLRSCNRVLASYSLPYAFLHPQYNNNVSNAWSKALSMLAISQAQVCE